MRTEEDILKDFEKIEYKVKDNSCSILVLKDCFSIISIDKNKREFEKFELYSYDNSIITLQEHKLLHELFECWNWI